MGASRIPGCPTAPRNDHLRGNQLPGWDLFSNYLGTVLFNSAHYDPIIDGTQAVQIEVPGDWISQTFATLIGAQYTVSFDLSAYTGYMRLARRQR